MWKLIDNGSTIGQVGSENGCIIADEEYRHSCRITLEKDGVTAPYSITCGVYGLMVHTIFAGSIAEAEKEFEEMKNELQAFIDSEDDDDGGNWCEKFVSKW